MNKNEASVILINTCSFIADARLEAEQEIKKALQWKKKNLKFIKKES